jgi:hypothetical protein
MFAHVDVYGAVVSALGCMVGVLLFLLLTQKAVNIWDGVRGAKSLERREVCVGQ